jgi:membrane protease YdiL (CAAX protease family)
MLQRNLSSRLGKKWGFFIATLIYTGVHIATGNIMLILAALICGIFWGWLFMRYDSMLMNIVSHTLWDLAVFIVFPFN